MRTRCPEQAASQQTSAEPLTYNTLLMSRQVLCRHVLGMQEEKGMASGLQEFTDMGGEMYQYSMEPSWHEGAMEPQEPDPDRSW